MKILEEAMTRGHIESAFALLIFLGVTGSGKSLFKKTCVRTASSRV